MKSIELSKEQMPFVSELESLISAYEDTMSIDLTTADINTLLDHLKVCQSLLATEARVAELSNLILGHVKGIILEEFMEKQNSSHKDDEFFAKMKVHEFRMWVEGRSTRWESLFSKAERVIKSFDNYNSHLVSCISAEKVLFQNSNQQT